MFIIIIIIKHPEVGGAKLTVQKRPEMWHGHGNASSNNLHVQRHLKETTLIFLCTVLLVSTGSFEALEITITEYTTTEITLVWGVVTGADRNNLPAGTNYEISISPLDTAQVHIVTGEPEGHYRCTKSMVIAPFWFSTDDVQYPSRIFLQWEEKMLKSHSL